MTDPATEPRRAFALEPFDFAEARDLMRALDLAEPVAVALVRRGYRTPDAARAFLAADESHDPSEFAGIDEAVAAIRAAVDGGKRITVHGDYDVDGVTATAILVGALRDLGADCDWLIPGRVEDGYGLSPATIDRLAERGTGLLITVDCGITATAEVALAQGRGIEVVVTDHHQPGPELPDCPLVHPLVSGYPCPDLCAAAVAHKLCAALLGPERADRDLDLVALATVADMVPLTGENRTLVRRGLEAARRGARVGLRALMAVASIQPERLAEDDLGFRLAPRINAAGRLYRADSGVELFLTGDPDRAAQIARELDRANLDRREAEREVLADAERRLRELEADGTKAAAIVLWGEGWHPGVVGICASRLAERHRRPAVLIALDEEGNGKGSGRSVPGYDLLAGLRACAEHLARFGGHQAAAGLEVESDRLEAFRAAFDAHAQQQLGDGPAAVVESVDAIVGGESLGHGVAEQLAALGPFGKGNPPVRLLVPGAQVTHVRPMGEEGRHARFMLASAGGRAPGVAFGVGSALERMGEAPHELSVRLELNEWNGAISPRVVLGQAYPAEPAPAGEWVATGEEHAARLAAALADEPAAPAAVLGPARERVERQGGSDVAAVAALASSCEPVLVVAADALWRRALLEVAAPPARFCGGEAALVACRGSLRAGLDAVERVLSGERGGVALADWQVLELNPELASRFAHVVLADPAPRPELEAIALAGPADRPGFLHMLGSSADPGLGLRALDLRFALRSGVARAYRGLREASASGAVSGDRLRYALCGPEGNERSPEWAATALRILAEIGIVRLARNGPATAVEVVSSVHGELEESAAYRAEKEAHEECTRFLTEARTRSSKPLATAA